MSAVARGPAPRRVCVFHPVMGQPLAAALRARHPELDVWAVTQTDRPPPEPDAIEALVAFRFPERMLAAMPRLRWLQLTSVGHDQVRAADRRPGLVLTTAGSVPAVAVAEYVLMGLLALAREAPTLVRQHDRRQWRMPGARLLHGKRMVMLGTGRVGIEVAKRASAFGVEVVGVNRSGRAPAPLRRVAEVRALSRELSEADSLVVCVPGDATTRGLVGAAAFEAMRPGCVLVDVSRPMVVDRVALVRALRRGVCRAAMLDVHASEPLPEDDPLWREPGVWVTPHCAFEQDDEVAALAELVSHNLAAWRSGTPLANLVEVPSLEVSR